MTNDTPAGAGQLAAYDKRLAALEKQVEILGRALAAEKKKTEALRATLDSVERGLDQTTAHYDRAFEQAAKSYEPIIQRALDLSGSTPPVGPALPTSTKTKPPAFFDNVTAIVDDLPKVLASLALIISLITGGTSIASFVKSTSAQLQAATASEDAGAAVQQATTAQVEASAANEKATTAQQNSEEAVTKATEAQVDAVTAKEKAETATETVEKVIKPVVEGSP
jgi:predicted  nucleic acid-binding Zn-ribbon protein